MQETVCQPTGGSSTRKSWPRQEAADILSNFAEQSSALGMSQHEFARRAGLARTTLQGWLNRQASIDAPAATVQFFESPEGLEQLHRIVVAAQFVITHLGAGGIRQVCTFLELSGLSPLVASSYGVQQQQIATMEEELGDFGADQRRILGAKMRHKPLTVCEDETFHPQICLVGLEPASGFILLEKYAKARDAATWTEAMAEATRDLPVELVQSTGDESLALIKHAEVDQGAHHSPDLFHVQHEVGKGTGAPMARRVRSAQKAVEDKTQHCERMQQVAKIHQSGSNHGRCSPAFVEKALAKAKQDEAHARHELEQARKHQEQMREAVRGLSESYHPYDLETGAMRSAELISQELDGHFATIDALADQVSLSQRCLERIDKARRVVVRMVATITFFHATLNERIEALELPEKIEAVLRERWIPGRYLELVAGRASGAELRTRLRQRAGEVGLSTLEQEVLLAGFSEEDRELLEHVVEDAAQLFQRSSSAVEGRNGHLDLFHHGHHRLSGRKLRALTTVHNYFKRRPDGSTAAGRFFEAEHQDLFEWLLGRMQPLPRPAQSRRKACV